MVNAQKTAIVIKYWAAGKPISDRAFGVFKMLRIPFVSQCHHRIGNSSPLVVDRPDLSPLLYRALGELRKVCGQRAALGTDFQHSEIKSIGTPWQQGRGVGDGPVRIEIHLPRRRAGNHMGRG